MAAQFYAVTLSAAKFQTFEEKMTGVLMGRNVGIMGELWRYMKLRKKFWLLPIILVMTLIGTLLIFAQGSALSPFIYTIF